jgi:hypothetical protein
VECQRPSALAVLRLIVIRLAIFASRLTRGKRGGYSRVMKSTSGIRNGANERDALTIGQAGLLEPGAGVVSRVRAV